MTDFALRVWRDGDRLHVAAYVEVGAPADPPLGTATARLPRGPGGDATVTVDVPPEHRRRGVGTALLDAVAVEAAGAGATTMSAEADCGGPGEAFLRRHGFGAVLPLVYLRLDLSALDDERLAELADLAGRPYRLEFWTGVPPRQLLEPMAVARSSMSDAPTGDLVRAVQPWDVARVVAVVEAVEARGDALHSVAALANDGAVAGYSEIVVPGTDGSSAQQYDTVVVPAHRGRGLGVLLKAALAQWARRELPELTVIETDNAVDNEHMRAVNERLGYREVRRTTWFQRGIPEAP